MCQLKADTHWHYTWMFRSCLTQSDVRILLKAQSVRFLGGSKRYTWACMQATYYIAFTVDISHTTLPVLINAMWLHMYFGSNQCNKMRKIHIRETYIHWKYSYCYVINTAKSHINLWQKSTAISTNINVIIAVCDYSVLGYYTITSFLKMTSAVSS